MSTGARWMTRGIPAKRCALAINGHIVAPPSIVISSRRRIRPPLERCPTLERRSAQSPDYSSLKPFGEWHAPPASEDDQVELLGPDQSAKKMPKREKPALTPIRGVKLVPSGF